jgi:hypothetical protein
MRALLSAWICAGCGVKELREARTDSQLCRGMHNLVPGNPKGTLQAPRFELSEAQGVDH